MKNNHGNDGTSHEYQEKGSRFFYRMLNYSDKDYFKIPRYSEIRVGFIIDLLK